MGQGPRCQHQEDRPRPSARPAPSRPITVSGWPAKARSAGAACIPGRPCSNTLRGNRSPADHRFPGRHGPHAALHHGLQRAQVDACFPPNMTGRTRRMLDEALNKMTDALRPWTIDLHVAAERRHREGHRLSRQDRPALRGGRPERQARHPHATPACGCATRTAS